MDYTDEQWRPIPDPRFAGYHVSNLARVKNAATSKILAQHINRKTGRHFVRLLGIGRKQYTITVATLVALAFLGPRPPGMQIDHTNGKLDDRAESLEYVDQSTNIQRAFDRGDHPYRPGCIRFLTQDEHDQIKALWATKKYSQVTIAKMMGITNATVSRIVNGVSRPRYLLSHERGPSRLEKKQARLEEARFHYKSGVRGAGRLGKAMGISRTSAVRYLREIRTSKGATDGSVIAAVHSTVTTTEGVLPAESRALEPMGRAPVEGERPQLSDPTLP